MLTIYILLIYYHIVSLPSIFIMERRNRRNMALAGSLLIGMALGG